MSQIAFNIEDTTRVYYAQMQIYAAEAFDIYKEISFYNHNVIFCCKQIRYYVNSMLHIRKICLCIHVMFNIAMSHVKSNIETLEKAQAFFTKFSLLHLGVLKMQSCMMENLSISCSQPG